MKNTVKRLCFNYKIYDFFEIEKRLNKYASKGLYLQSIKRNIWTYKKDDIRDVKYVVRYMPLHSFYVNEDRYYDSGEVYIDLASEFDYELVASTEKIQIYVTHKDNPLPLEKFSREKFDIINYHMDKISSQMLYMALTLSLLFALFCYYAFKNQLSFFSDNYGMFVVSSIGLGAMFYTAVLANYYSWRSTNKTFLEIDEGFSGESVKIPFKLDVVLIMLMIINLVLLLFNIASEFGALLVLPIIIALPTLFYILCILFKYINNSNLEKRKAKIAYFVSAILFTSIFLNILNFVVLNIASKSDNFIEDYSLKTESVFMENITYYDIDDIEYTIITPKYEFVYKWILKNTLDGDYSQSLDTNFNDAIVYENNSYYIYMLFYKDNIIMVSYRGAIFKNDIEIIEGKIKHGNKNTKIL